MVIDAKFAELLLLRTTAPAGTNGGKQYLHDRPVHSLADAHSAPASSAAVPNATHVVGAAGMEGKDLTAQPEDFVASPSNTLGPSSATETAMTAAVENVDSAWRGSGGSGGSSAMDTPVG